MRNWKNLGAVETIYEEEYEFSSSSTSSSLLSPCPSSPPTPLHTRVEKWSLVVGKKPELVIKVCGKFFHLHKDPLTSRSTYLKRHLTDSVTELTLSPPLNISAETFTLVADFCYGATPVITPFNLASLRTAAELLEMTEVNDDDSLVRLTDAYFRQVVAVNPEYASIVFRSALTLLPEAETAAFLISGCVEALNLTENSDGVGDGDLFEDVMLTVCPEDFHLVAEAMQRRFNNHDVVYRIVDLYIRGQNGKMTEEQKSRISSSVDCNKLSHKTLLDAVQNPAMPLRFVVRAMLADQLTTRRHILSSSSSAAMQHLTQQCEPLPLHHPAVDTLGALLQRDAAARQASSLKASLHATTARIRHLERELSSMKNLLLLIHHGENNNNNNNNNAADIRSGGGRSASLRVERAAVRKEDRLSASLRFVTPAEGNTSCSSGGGGNRASKRIGRGLINGIKRAFGVRTSHSTSTTPTTSSSHGGIFGGKKTSQNNDVNEVDRGQWEYDNDVVVEFDHGCVTNERSLERLS